MLVRINDIYTIREVRGNGYKAIVFRIANIARRSFSESWLGISR